MATYQFPLLTYQFPFVTGSFGPDGTWTMNPMVAHEEIRYDEFVNDNVL